MRKWLIAGGVLLILCVVLIVALLNVNALVRRNKDYILAQAEQALGRKLAVGDVELAIWNGIGVRLTNFQMSDDPAFSSGNFVQARDLQVNVRLWPLLRKEVQVKRLILHQPVIQVLRNERGVFNFSTIGGAKEAEKKKKEPPATRERPAEDSAAFLISLIDISQGVLRYRDRKAGTDLQVERIDLQVEDLDFERPFSVELGAALFAPRQNLKVNSRIGPLGREPDPMRVPLDGTITIDPLDVTRLKAAVPDLKSLLPRELDLSGVFSVKDLKFKGTLQDLTLSGALQGTDGAIAYGNTFQKPVGVPLIFTPDLRYTTKAVSIRKADLKLHSAELSTKGQIGLVGTPTLDLTIDTKPATLQGWDRLVPALQSYELSGRFDLHAAVRGRVGQGAVPHVQGTLNLNQASARPPQFPKPIRDLNTTINFTGQRADIKDTTLSLGNSKIRLSAAIDSFAPFALSYRISTPEIWPADFQQVPPDRKNDVLQNVASDGRLLVKNKTLTYQGKLTSAQGTLYRIAYKGLDAALSIADNVANIRSLRLNALDGSAQFTGEYAFNNPVPRFSLNTKLQGIDIQQAYSAFELKGERDIRGKFNGDMRLAGSGRSWEEIKPALRGQGQAEVLQGALMNFNIAESVLSGITGVPGLTNLINPQVRKKYPETFEAKDTEFKELRADFDIGNSRVNVKSLRISAAEFLVNGKGSVDFDRRVDFRSVLAFSQRLSADLAGSAREVKYLFNNQGQLEIPFGLTGTLPNVKPRPDTDLLARAVQRGLLQRGSEEIQRRLFGGRKETTPPPSQAVPSEPERRKETPEDLIRKGLDRLFR